MSDNLKERMEVVKQLTELFKIERMVYLVIRITSLIILIAIALSLILKGQAGYAELTFSFGSSELITYSTGRLLIM